MRQRNPNKPKFKPGELVRYKKHAYYIRVKSSGIFYWIQPVQSHLGWCLASEDNLRNVSFEEAFFISL